MSISKKKAQLTVFMIIIIMLLVISVVFYVSVSKSNRNKSDVANVGNMQAEKSYDSFNIYMQSCLNDALQDGLFQIGRQGGVFYPSQKGSSITYPIRSAEFSSGEHNTTYTYNVSYLNEPNPPDYILQGDSYPCIKSNEWTVPSYNPSLIEQKCMQNYSHSMPDFLLHYNWQQIGNSSLETMNLPLCKEPQVIQFLNGTISDHDVNITVCPGSNQKNYQLSLEYQLESYISYRMDECFLDALQSLEDAGLTTSELGIMNVSVIFNDDSTVANVFFPLTLVSKNVNSTTKQFSYYSLVPVRLRLLYASIYGNNVMVKHMYLYNQSGTIVNKTVFRPIREGLLYREFSNISFRIIDDSKSFFSSYDIEGLSVERSIDRTGSYILRFIDQKSVLNGEPYEYHVRIWNRQPALDTITSQNTLNDIDLVFYENSSLLLSPLAFDPDDQGSSLFPLEYQYYPEGDWSWRTDSFTKNGLYQTGSLNGVVCSHPLYGLTINRCSYFDLNRSDIGVHTLRIVVKDYQRSSDGQLLKILVDYFPNISFSINNIFTPLNPTLYPGRFVDNNHVFRYVISREDPFIINTSTSLISIGPYENLFSWYIVGKGKNEINISNINTKNYFSQVYPFNFSSQQKNIVHPNFFNSSSYENLSSFLHYAKVNRVPASDIAQVRAHLKNYKSLYAIYNISEYSFPFGVTFPQAGGQFETMVLNYYKQNYLSNYATREIYLTSCIPYRSDIPSYPYNLLRQDSPLRTYIPYYANHTCCIGDLSSPLSWRVESFGVPCFDYFDIGTYDEMMSPQLQQKNISVAIFEDIYPDYSSNLYVVPNVVLPNDASFDRYVRTLQGECDGIRGNICRPQSFEIQRIPYCGATQTPAKPIQISLNNTIINTDVQTSDDNFGPDAWSYGGGLCICKYHNQPLIINMSNTSIIQLYDIKNQLIEKPINSVYCCYGTDGLPENIRPHPCTIPSCNVSKSVSIGEGYLDPEYYQPTSYCKCGNDIANTTSQSNFFCCNRFGTGILQLTNNNVTSC